MGYEIELELRKFVAPEFVFGANARLLASRYAKNFGARRVLVVTDQGVLNAGWTAEVVRNLEAEGFSCAIFKDVTSNPRAEEVMAAAQAYHEGGCDAIVAVGGGSPMDCAKGVGIVSSNGAHILRFEGVDNVEHPLPPLICIPTTSGSSADVSQFAIITDTDRNVKIAIVSKTIVPDVSLIDPVTTTTMDADLTAHTGLDALVHAVEAFVSNAHSPITDSHALEAIRLVSAALPEAADNLESLQFRGKMMLGSLFAGLAFSNASLGAVHAMAHSLGGLLDLPHGECNAVLLEHVVQHNFAFATTRYRRIAEAMGVRTDDVNDDDLKDVLVDAIRKLRRTIGVDVTLGQLGMKREDIPRLASNALNDCCLVTNPAKLSQTDIEQIYEQAL
jgi:alcohol dehydrogenase class IV